MKKYNTYKINKSKHKHIKKKLTNNKINILINL